jgi:RNA polymerase sigma-70 factor (ECF subfamily)
MNLFMTGIDRPSSTAPDLTDQTLMRRFRSGEQDAASSLYMRYAKRLQQLATRQTSTELSFRVTSEEIVQSVFRTFFRRVSNGQYDAVDGDDLWRLFLVISLNKIRSAAEFHRAQKRDSRRTKSANAGNLGQLATSPHNDEAAFTVLKMTIDELLGELPKGHAEIIRLRIEGNTLPDIAEKTDRAQRTIERVLQRFREILMQTIEE